MNFDRKSNRYKNDSNSEDIFNFNKFSKLKTSGLLTMKEALEQTNQFI